MSASGNDELVFLPLGGSGEIGMNLNAYGFGPPDDRRWIIVDIGVTFGNQFTPGVDLILPDPGYLEDFKDDILAIVLTHAHEDHIGAIGHLWPRLPAPIYATPFTAYLVREKLKEHGLDKKAKVTEVPLGGTVKIGPFDVRYVTLTHSIPEPNGLEIKTPLGVVWHTGDWKIDPAPQIGEVTDEARVRAMGDADLLAMVCDSTNVFVEGTAGSEEDVREQLARVVGDCAGKVAVTAFASNVARVESAMKAAARAGRKVCLVGRSMHRIVGAAKSVGLLADAPPLVSEDQAASLEPHEVLYLCTGSQGEPRAALSRIASGDHRTVKLGEGDTAIFSSRVIPGNEIAIHQLQDGLVERGVRVLTDRDAPIHVSGHPARDELKQMYAWARPRIAVPVHGERRHILEHAALARSLQTPEAIAPQNGDLIRLAPGPAAVIDQVPSGRLHLDGSAIVEADGEAIKERLRLSSEGVLVVTFAISKKKGEIVSQFDVRTRGMPADDEDALEEALDQIAQVAETAFQKLAPAARLDGETAEETVVKAVRRASERIWRKRPLVDVVILKV